MYFRVVQVIKSLQDIDPLEVGNDLSGINDNVRCQRTRPGTEMFLNADGRLTEIVKH